MSNEPKEEKSKKMINGKIADPEASARLLAVTDSGMECSEGEDDVLPEVKITLTEPLASQSGSRLRAKAKRQSTRDSFRAGNWKLKYKDFVAPAHGFPHGKFIKPEKWSSTSCTFNKLIENANDWLSRNNQLQVKSVQSVLWSSGDPFQLDNSSQMVISKNTRENTLTYYQRGIRLWLEPKADKQCGQTLCFMDFIPDKKYYTIQNLVEKINQKINNKQLKGRIVTIETVSYHSDDGHKVDVKATKWCESMNEDVYYVFILRAYYVKDGSNENMKLTQASTVCIKNMIPMETQDGYEAFECLVERANDWLKAQPNATIINMASVIVKKDYENYTDLETGSGCFYTMPGLNATTPVDFFRILRIVYLAVPGENTPNITHLYPFNYETFTPEIIKEKDGEDERLESMPETFSKVIAFLRNTGADVVNAEMVYYPMQLYTQQNCAQNSDDLNFLYTIRLYLTGNMNPGEGFDRAIKRGSVVSTSSRRNGHDKSRARNGPIFLRSVVNRQFKYRWLVLAVSAISCMSIIVVVSVVYSNR